MKKKIIQKKAHYCTKPSAWLSHRCLKSSQLCPRKQLLRLFRVGFLTFPLFGLTHPLAGAFPSLGAHLIMHDQEHGRAARLPSRARVTAAREFDRWERWDSFHGPRPPRALRIAEDYQGHIPAQSPAWERRTCSESWGVVGVIILMKLLTMR